MKTTRIALFYQITQTEVYPPSATELERKDRWIKELQKTVEADFKPLIIKVLYEMFDPEVEDQRRFFEGVVVLYWLIQNKDIFTGVPDTDMLDKAREEILDETLGYDFQAISKIIRKRKSTKDFKIVQKWNTFLNTLRETIFDPEGYSFPDSEAFWLLVEEYGYEQAKKISIQELQRILIAKHKSV